MTIIELAQELKITVPKLIEHFKTLSIDIPQDENYKLSAYQIRNFIPDYNSKKQINHQIKDLFPNISKYEVTKLEDLSSKLKKSENFNARKDFSEHIIQGTKQTEVPENFEEYFRKSNKVLIQEFKEHNSVDNLLLEGKFRSIIGKSFGFFENVSHQNGTNLIYPVINETVDNIFIPTNELLHGKKYIFEADITRKNLRKEKGNPYLLEAKKENIQEIIELSVISQELITKQTKLERINEYLEKADEHFEKKKIEIADKLLKEYLEQESIAKNKMDSYNEIIETKFKEIQSKEQKIISLDESIDIKNNNLLKMENLINTLKDRVSVCRKLQFINEDDENKYLNHLSLKEFKPDNHLDFENDFEKSFSKLSDHIHSYLFHKKNLIYTRYQIRNFLTLLKTHDIIVLSGLSGSGKTQIVKAFAESMGGIAKIIPVKPNWTSSDDLIGYYNPLQMSFLPTPFTEAIVEAIHNPNQLYFICLDEMNLARAEYYFADFLSKLEDRSETPEIELYANHEEDLFVSEFKTLLNLVESSIKDKQINSWQEFLDNEESRKKFFEMLGNTEKESMLQLHAKMKRRLTDILKFPSTIKIPRNIRFIGAINVDETTHYFSPKILDRIHVVKFENPLLFEESVNQWFDFNSSEKDLKPVYIHPSLFPERSEYPSVNNSELINFTQKLKEINEKYLLPLNIDFGVRSIRQALNYAELNKSTYDYGDIYDISLNTIIFQKILPRFMFDGSETAKNKKSKIEVVEEFQKYLSEEFEDLNDKYESYDTDIGKSSSEYLAEMIEHAKSNSNSQFNFFA